MRQVLYEANSAMGENVRKGVIVSVDLIAEDTDTKTALVLSRGTGQYECPCMFLVKPHRDGLYYVNIGGQAAFININKKLSKKFLDLAK